MGAARAFAIGDVHGRLDLLDALLEEIAPTAQDQLIFLGDYVDRGPDSRGVVDRLIALAGETRCVFLRGNHDVSFLSIATGLGRLDLATYLGHDFGGRATLESYGASAPTWTDLDVPPQHLSFLHRLALWHLVESGGRRIMLTHAGVDLARSMDEQGASVLLWGTRHFLPDLEQAAEHARAGESPVGHFGALTLVFGHYQSLQLRDHRPAGIGIDTGCGTLPEGRLTALDLDGFETLSV